MKDSTILTPLSRAAEFREALRPRPWIADGAMGTMLLARRALVSRSLDELNLSLPALVRDVHQEYVRAGAEILETNTFGANRPRLAAFGFAERVRAVNQAGVRIAREAAREQAFVAGAVGPLGLPLEPLGSLSPDAARTYFREQIDALASAGVDLLVLETFRDLDELYQAVLAARESAGPDMTVVAHLSVEDDGTLADGTALADYTRRMDEWPVDAIGLNCSGPAAMLEAIQQMLAYTNKPLSAMPSAGLPAEGRYTLSPEYLARYATRFLRAGVSILGGCCGVTPEHIRAIATEVREVPVQAPAARNVTVSERARAVPQENLPPAQKSRLGEKLTGGTFVTLIEIHQPRGVDATLEIQTARQAKQLGMDALTAVEGPGARLSTAAICQWIQREADVEMVLPFRFRGRGSAQLVSEILGVHATGLRNLVCLDGGGFDALGITHAVNQLNRGLDLGGNALGSKTSLLVGVSVNPAAADPEQEMRSFEARVKAGAEFAIAEPVFDPGLLEDFHKAMEPCRVPLIAIVRPLRSVRDAEFMIHERGVPVPAAIIARMSLAQTEEDARIEGLAIAREFVEQVKGFAGGVQWSRVTLTEATGGRV